LKPMKSSFFGKFGIFLMAAVLAVLLALFVCFSFIRGRKRQNVILISIDTCRADHLSCYGHPINTTPNIDAIAKEGILFENVITPVPLTTAAHGSILTGTIPLYHGIHDNKNYKLDTSITTLAEVLAQNDFNTGAIVSSMTLDSAFNLDKGFIYYDDQFVDEQPNKLSSERKGDQATDCAVSWIQKNKDEKFFLFLHYYDPHDPWEPPEPFRSLYQPNPYAGEVAFVDHCIGQFIDKLKKLGLYDSTLIIITGDHGESLEEHGEKTHGYFIYQSTLEVPLILKIPGSKKSLRVLERAGIVDILPTICSLLGINPPAQIQGKDLSGYFLKKNYSEKGRAFYCESLIPTYYDCNPLVGIVQEDYKYIHTTRPELYDLNKDRKELINLTEEQPQRKRIMEDRLKQIIQDISKMKTADSKITLGAETLVQLESLGYVASAKSDDPSDFDPTRKDPKDMIEFHLLNSEVEVKIVEGRFTEAKKICSKMLELYPELPSTYQLLGTVAYKEGRYEKAAEYLSRFVQLNPKSHSVYNNLGLLLIRLNRIDEAVVCFKKSIEIRPRFSPEIYYNLAIALGTQGKIVEAVSDLEIALQMDSDNKRFQSALKHMLAGKDYFRNVAEYLNDNPNSPEAHLKMAGFFYRQNNLEESVKHCREALKLKPDYHQARYNLAHILFLLNRRKEALEEYYILLNVEPESVDTLNSIAWILAATEDKNINNPSEAVKLAEKACELTDYKMPRTLDTLSVAYAAGDNFSKAIETAQKAIDLARSADRKDLVDMIQKRQDLYRLHHPYYEP